MDVVNQVSPGLSRLHKQGLEAALEQVTVLLAVAIEAHRESRLQPAHSGRQIAPRRPKAKVEMVRHQAIRRQFPTELPASLEQSRLERRLRSVGIKDPRTIIATIYDMVQSIVGLESVLRRHREQKPQLPQPVKPL